MPSSIALLGRGCGFRFHPNGEPSRSVEGGSNSLSAAHQGRKGCPGLLTMFSLQLAVKSLSCGFNFTIMCSEDRTLWGWGENSYGQLGLSTLEPVYSPQRVLGVRDVAAVSAGWAHSLIITTHGTLWTVGWNKYGQCGTASATADDGNTRAPLLLIATDYLIVKGAAGHAHSLLLTG